MTDNVYKDKNSVPKRGLPVSDEWNSSGECSAISLEIQGFAATRRELSGQVDQFYDEHYEAVYRYLVLSGSLPADADEILQEAFIRLFRLLSTGGRVEKPRNWLLRVCHNLRVDEVRREDRNPSVTQQAFERYARAEPDPQPNPESRMLAGERIERVRTALGQLNKRQREFLLLRADGLKLREIAELYGVTVQSVAESCARAIDKLGKLIHE
ncbi:MAG TPA: sigma-70 family RNA polymerase sigma factor [Bryobacteraceae bacterium]|nr:sigma-70 family RNA polymerase sigma factor [Bryobacteraceae bacterium]